jgi:hypothetical protein
MHRRSQPPNDPVRRTLDLELALIRDAIAMVAAGGSPRVTVASLHFGEQLIGPATTMALRAGVRLVPLWTADETGAAIAIERIVDD